MLDILAPHKHIEYESRRSMESGMLQNLAIVMVVAGIVTLLFRSLRQPVTLGYILAGFLIGPHTPQFPIVVNEESIRTLADLGIIFLLFCLGLEFNLRKLVKVGFGAGLAAPLEIGFMLWLGFQLGRGFGWNTTDSIFLGAMLSISSSTIAVKTLGELGKNKEPFAQMIFGLLIVEDIAAVAMLALLSGVAISGSLDPVELISTLGRIGIFFTTVLVMGLLIVPALMRYAARFKSDEMILIVTLGLCFGVSLLAAESGFSVALGAFLIGAIVAETRESGRIVLLIEPVRDMFSAVFFVTIGMLIDPALLFQYAGPIAALTVAVILGKSLSCSVGAFLAGYDGKTALRVGAGMAQIGEFSYIIAQLGLSLGVISEHLYPVAVSVSALTVLCMPYLLKSADGAYLLGRRIVPARIRTSMIFYHEWAAGLRSAPQPRNEIQRIIRRSLFQIVLNLVLVAGLLIGAGTLGYRFDILGRMHISLPSWAGGSTTILWLGAVIISLPLIVATLRKTHAVAMILAEMSVARAVAKERTDSLRALIVNTVMAITTAFVIGWMILLSTAILPPWPVLPILLIVMIATTLVLWRSFIKLYARAQISLRETFAREHVPHLGHATRPLPSLLESAILELVRLDDSSTAAGKLIRELEIRSKTGASVIGIERSGESMVNPSPDEELHAADHVLLLGSHEQLAAATRLLEAKPIPHDSAPHKD